MNRRFLLLLLLVMPLLLAFRMLQQVLPPQVEQAVFWIIALLVGWVGPYPLEILFKALNLSGIPAVVITFAASLLIGLLGVFVAKTILGYEIAGDYWSVAFLVLAASQVAFNRLKGQGKMT